MKNRKNSKNNVKKEIKSDYFMIKEIKEPSSLVNIFRDHKDVYKSFNKIMMNYEEGFDDIALLLVCDIQPVILQQLALFCSYFSIQLYLLPSTISTTLESIFNEKIRIIGVKKDSEALKKMSSILKDLIFVEKDIYL
ncbi:hypothetical protein NGRA_2215 [Nosema granulosis]|uniref:Uncharacterized protein n=1 Tax=Nosema granulosis TaxID=83296 RepID=A0A9P6GY27_9MICR|nr:hypothetical protein NGRA_2215 [Nosema granulosis]